MTGPVQYHLGAFPPKTIDWESLIPLIGPASAAVARYDGTLAAIPNADVLLSPLTTREAVLSSRIEGTQATMGEVLEFEADYKREGLSQERRDDIYEVLNYRKAMRLAEEMLQKIPLSLRVFRKMHSVLLEGVRGEGKAGGEFRKVPNWIGPPGSTIAQARYVPISADKLPKAMSGWERYLHEQAPDLLVQLAIAHAEFEALHPFLDGNGRLGRMLIPLFLWQRKLIRRPMFYISAYLEANRDAYYDGLTAVSRDKDWTGWCSFFLKAVQKQAEENQQKAADVLRLHNELKPKIFELTQSKYSIKVLDWIFQRPIFRSTDLMTVTKIPEPTTRRILSALKKKNVLREIDPRRGRQAATFAFSRLLNIVEGQDAF
jgi:Fic family protein